MKISSRDKQVTKTERCYTLTLTETEFQILLWGISTGYVSEYDLEGEPFTLDEKEALEGAMCAYKHKPTPKPVKAGVR